MAVVCLWQSLSQGLELGKGSFRGQDHAPEGTAVQAGGGLGGVWADPEAQDQSLFALWSHAEDNNELQRPPLPPPNTLCILEETSRMTCLRKQGIIWNSKFWKNSPHMQCMPKAWDKQGPVPLPSLRGQADASRACGHTHIHTCSCSHTLMGMCWQ